MIEYFLYFLAVAMAFKLGWSAGYERARETGLMAYNTFAKWALDREAPENRDQFCADYLKMVSALQKQIEKG